MGLHRLRIKVFPIALGPLGASTIPAPALPMPTAVTIDLMEPVLWPDLDPPAADDDGGWSPVLRGGHELLQRTLDRLRVEDRHPVRQGWSRLPWWYRTATPVVWA